MRGAPPSGATRVAAAALAARAARPRRSATADSCAPRAHFLGGEGPIVLEAGGRERRRRAFAAIDQRKRFGHCRAPVLECGGGLQTRAAGGDRVVDHRRAELAAESALDLLLQAVRFRLLAHEE